MSSPRRIVGCNSASRVFAGRERNMLFVLRRTRRQEFLLFLVLMHSIFFVDRAKVAAAAGGDAEGA
jgi:hypothetical protein